MPRKRIAAWAVIGTSAVRRTVRKEPTTYRISIKRLDQYGRGRLVIVWDELQDLTGMSRWAEMPCRRG